MRDEVMRYRRYKVHIVHEVATEGKKGNLNMPQYCYVEDLVWNLVTLTLKTKNAMNKINGTLRTRSILRGEECYDPSKTRKNITNLPMLH
jgi:hypothetical protein